MKQSDHLLSNYFDEKRFYQIFANNFCDKLRFCRTFSRKYLSSFPGSFSRKCFKTGTNATGSLNIKTIFLKNFYCNNSFFTKSELFCENFRENRRSLVVFVKMKMFGRFLRKLNRLNNVIRISYVQ